MNTNKSAKFKEAKFKAFTVVLICSSITVAIIMINLYKSIKYI